MTEAPKRNIAVIGAGVAGIVTAFLLQQKHRVTIFEQEKYIGGHTKTVELPSGPDAGCPVDTGFIVFNNRTYPNFTEFLHTLDVAIRESDMSFGFYSEKTKFHYAGTTLNGLFSDRLNLLRPSFYAMLRDIKRFAADGYQALNTGSAKTKTVGEFIAEQNYGSLMVEAYLVPMTAAIWSAPTEDVLKFPADTLFRFYQNHGLLSLKDRPRWLTVRNGSFQYLKAFRERFRGEIRENEVVQSIRRESERVEIRTISGAVFHFDDVVVATHADQALKLLADPTPEETRLLSPWEYRRNQGFLHTDETVCPPNRRAWASWNYRQLLESNSSAPVTVTYHMNRLQGLRTLKDYFVTFNYSRKIEKSKIVRELDFSHPVYSLRSVATQSALPSLNGVQRTYFCGSYFGYGFHEDAVTSAVNVARHFQTSFRGCA